MIMHDNLLPLKAEAKEKKNLSETVWNELAVLLISHAHKQQFLPAISFLSAHSIGLDRQTEQSWWLIRAFTAMGTTTPSSFAED